MFIRPRRLSLITTYRCTAACDHCCFGCTPSASQSIPVARLHGLIEEAREIGSIEEIGFTGGECFLLGRELDALVEAAISHGFRAQCVTNGYWAVNENAAMRRMTALAAAGPLILSLSSGDRHAEFVPPERVVHAAVAAVKRGCTTRIAVEHTEGSAITPLRFLRDPALTAPLADGRLIIIEAPWVPNGDGLGRAELRHHPDYHRFATRPERCDSIMETVSVTPALDLMACCGMTMTSIPELRLGSVAQRTIAEVLGSAQDDLVKMWLHVEGPEEILRFVASHDEEYRLPLLSASRCTTCLELHRDQRAMAVLRRHAHEVEERVVNAFLSMQLARECKAREARAAVG